MFRSVVLICGVSFVMLGQLSPATAGTLNPNPANGNPSVAKVNFNHFEWEVSLIPDPANYRSPDAGCPWLLPASQAANQPYNNSATDVWNFTYAGAFNGTFNVTAYGAVAQGGFGGADFTITYVPGLGDPTGNDVRWVSVIDTNLPSARGTAYGVAGTGGNGIAVGHTAYLDNEGQANGARPATGYAPTDPWYGWLSVPAGKTIIDSAFANSTGFTDSVRLSLVDGRIWEAQTFLEKETTRVEGGKTIHDVSIYGGVWWGFQDKAVRATAAPEPSSWALLACGGGILMVIRRRKASDKNTQVAA